MSKPMTLSFRAEPDLIEQIALAAKIVRQNRADYMKQAVGERNERILTERVAFLSKQLSAQSLAECKELDAASPYPTEMIASRL